MASVSTPAEETPAEEASAARLASPARPSQPSSVHLRKNKKQNTGKRARPRGPDDKRHGPPVSYDGEGRPLWIRPSDGQSVYLECCFPACGRSNFKTIHGLMTHMAAQPHGFNVRGHGLKDFLKTQSNAVEMCGRLAAISAASSGGPESQLSGSASASNTGPLDHTLAEKIAEADPTGGGIADESSLSAWSTLEASSTLAASSDPDVEPSNGSGRPLPADSLHQAALAPGLLSGAYLFDSTASMENNATAVSDGQWLQPDLKRKRSMSGSYNPSFEQTFKTA